MHFFVIILIIVCPVNSEFNSSVFRSVKTLAFDVAREYNCGCLYVIQADNAPYREDQTLRHFTNYLTRGIREKDYRRLLHTGMYKHSGLRQHFEFGMRVRAVTCFKSLVVAIGNERMKHNLEEIFRTQTIANTMWVVILNSSISDFFENSNMNLASRVYAINNQHFPKLYEIYRVGKNFPLRINEVADWTPARGFKKNNWPRYVRRRNLEGIVVKTTSAHPVINISNPREYLENDYFPNVWRELEEVLNFTSWHIGPTDGSPGLPRENGEWTGHLGMIQRGEVDAIISALDFSPWRLEVVRYLLPLTKSRFQIFFRSKGFVADWWSIFRPFSPFVWAAIIGWIVVGSTVLYCCNSISIKKGLDGARKFSFINSTFFVLQAACVQGSNCVPKVGSVRIIYVVSYLVSSVILAAYSGALISSLTKKSPVKPYDNFQQLIKVGDPLIIGNSTSSIEYFTNTDDATLRQVYNKLAKINGSNFNKLRRYVCDTDGVAIFSNEENMEYWLQHYGRPCKLSKFSQPLSRVYQSMGFSKNSSFTDLINYTILRLAERGILKRVKDHFQMRKIDPEEAPLIIVSIWDVREVFLFLVCSMIVSLTILLLEIYYYKRGLQPESISIFNYQE